MEPAELFDRYRQLRQYVGWSDYDVQRVRSVGGAIEPYLGRIVDDFYEEIERHQETRTAIRGGRAQVKRLKATLLAWLQELFTGRYDRDYVSGRWRVGWRHVEIGLDRIFVSAAFARMRAALTSAVCEAWQGPSPDLLATIQSLNRLLDLDLAIIEYAYHTESLNRQQIIRELHEREQRLRAILNTCADGIIAIKRDGIIETFNPAAEQMFGYSAAEAIGNHVRMLMPPPYSQEHDQYIANYLETGEAKIIGIGREAAARRKDGSTFPVELAVTEIDHLQLFIGIIRDISLRKQTEQRLLQSERLAAVGQMITGLAHESRNAFQRSQACLEVLELEVQDQPEALELVQRIHRAHDHLHHLYEEVRDYAAPITLKRAPHSLAELWRDTWAHLDVMRRDRRVKLREEVGKTELTCEVDENAIEQLFRNILENAIVACAEPGEIVIRCDETRLGERPAVRVSIVDNGSGFGPEEMARVFEPFYTTKARGTGLGMAIAQRIVEAHGGTITVGNCPAGGQVVVTLPRQ
jgi:PAS domain S-box-containing protein